MNPCYSILDWGIRFEEAYEVPKREQAEILYAGREELMYAIREKYPPKERSKPAEEPPKRRPSERPGTRIKT